MDETGIDVTNNYKIKLGKMSRLVLENFCFPSDMADKLWQISSKSGNK